jgi:hypothetical protein
MSNFNVQSALSNTFYQALNRYSEGGLTAGGGVAGIQRPELDRFDATGTQLIKSDEVALQVKPDDYRDPKSMTKWTQTDGKWTKSTTAPPQDPALNTFLHGLADKLSTLPDQTYMVPAYLEGKIDPGEVSKTEAAFAAENYPSDIRDESPQLQDLRNQIRSDIAKAGADTVSANPVGYEQTALGMIHDDGIRNSIQKALTDAQTNTDGGQAQFFTAPSSSTGKYHPADEINVGGLALHSLRDVEMGNKLCEIYNVVGMERDEVLGALAVHDIEKGGANWSGYAGDHGPQGQQYLDKIWGVDPSSDDNVANPDRHMAVLVGRHMAQWNDAPLAPGQKYSDPAPLVPRNIDEQIVSYADYLGALDNVYVAAPNAATKTP